MTQGNFSYKANLERARKALLDNAGSDFSAPTAQEQVANSSQGLMRPRQRPQEPQTGFVAGFGLGLMKSLEAPKESPTRPQARPGSERQPDPTIKDRPRSRGGRIGADPSERDLLAATLQAEAAGEGLSGMVAAGSVINNRVASGNYGTGIRGVIMKDGQFSAWNGVTGYAGGEGAIDMANLRVSDTAYEAADKILSGSYTDETGGATHYYNPNVATPAWGSTAGGNWLDIGNHRFGFGDGDPGGR